MPALNSNVNDLQPVSIEIAPLRSPRYSCFVHYQALSMNLTLSRGKRWIERGIALGPFIEKTVGYGGQECAPGEAL